MIYRDDGGEGIEWEKVKPRKALGRAWKWCTTLGGVTIYRCEKQVGVVLESGTTIKMKGMKGQTLDAMARVAAAYWKDEV